jgi:hypothetical protein
VTHFRKMNIAVLAPIPRASVSTAAIEKRGDLRIDRVRHRMSCNHLSIEATSC